MHITFLSQEGHTLPDITSVFEAGRWKGERLVPALPAGKKMLFRTNLSPTKADFLGLMDEKGVTCPPTPSWKEGWGREEFVSLLSTREGQEWLYATAPQLKYDLGIGRSERQGSAREGRCKYKDGEARLGLDPSLRGELVGAQIGKPTGAWIIVEFKYRS